MELMQIERLASNRQHIIAIFEPRVSSCARATRTIAAECQIQYETISDDNNNIPLGVHEMKRRRGNSKASCG